MPTIDYVNYIKQPVATTNRVFLTNWAQPGFGATSGAIDANDALGDPFAWSVPRYGMISSVSLIDIDDDTLAATVHIFNRPFTAAASDAAFTIALLSDVQNWVTSQVMGTPLDIGAGKVVTNSGLFIYYEAPLGQLYSQLSSTGTPTIAGAATMPFIRLAILPLGI